MGTFVGIKTAPKFRNLGFTLIELMVTISIAAILLAIAVPSFRDFILGQRIKKTRHTMFHIR
ncbi:Tfp pilus assembly protein FimT/FimU [Undibacterium arcticum]